MIILIEKGVRHLGAFLFNFTNRMNKIEQFFNAIRTKNQEQLVALATTYPELVNSNDSRGFTPLIFATYFDNKEAAKVLLDHKANIDAQDGTGNTALIGVCFKGNLELVDLLLNHGAAINVKNNLGTTPLIFAAMYNQEAVIKVLLKEGADKTIKDNEGKTAFDHASEKGYNNLLSLLS